MSSCFELVSNVNKATMGAGKSELAGKTRLVLTALLNAQDHTLTRQQILKRHWGDVDAMDLDKITQTLSQAGAIDCIGSGGKMCYTVKEEIVRQYEQAKGKAN
jgi:hypothetical protein